MIRKQEIFEKWGIKENPFHSFPPKNEKIRNDVFTGRYRELGTLIDYSKESIGVYLYGISGSGKTMLCRELKASLKAKEESEKLKLVYCSYNPEYGFMKSLLSGAAESLNEKLGELVKTILRGNVITIETVKKAGITGGLFEFFKAQIEASKTESMTFQISNSFLWLAELLKDYKKIVFIIEDMEKVTIKEETSHINMMLRDLYIEFNSGFLITGYEPSKDFGLNFDVITISKGIKELTKREYMQMCKQYLNSVREKKMTSCHPFEENLLEWLAEKFSKLFFTPRLFNLACFYILEEAAKEGIKKIEMDLGKDYLFDNFIELFSSLKQNDIDELRKLINKSNW